MTTDSLPIPVEFWTHILSFLKAVHFSAPFGAVGATWRPIVRSSSRVSARRGRRRRPGGTSP
jgi:hypothetical protein